MEGAAPPHEKAWRLSRHMQAHALAWESPKPNVKLPTPHTVVQAGPRFVPASRSRPWGKALVTTLSNKNWSGTKHTAPSIPSPHTPPPGLCSRNSQQKQSVHLSHAVATVIAATRRQKKKEEGTFYSLSYKLAQPPGPCCLHQHCCWCCLRPSRCCYRCIQSEAPPGWHP